MFTIGINTGLFHLLAEDGGSAKKADDLAAKLGIHPPLLGMYYSCITFQATRTPGRMYVAANSRAIIQVDYCGTLQQWVTSPRLAQTSTSRPTLQSH